MNFLNPFWKSSFYTENKEKHSFWKAFFRLVLVSFFIGVIYACLFYLHFGKDIPNAIYSFETKISDGYPADLTLSIKDKKLVKNIPGEIKLYPTSLFDQDIQENLGKDIRHLIVIDDTKEVTLASFETSGALIFFGKDGFIAKDTNKTQLNSYNGFEQMSPDTTFSKNVITNFFAVINKFVPSIPVAITIIIIVFCTLFAPLGNLVYLVFAGLLLMLLSTQILRRKVLFGEAYILAMYALPSIIIIEFILSYIPYVSVVLSFIPFSTTIGLFLFLAYMYKENKHTGKQEVITE